MDVMAEITAIRTERRRLESEMKAFREVMATRDSLRERVRVVRDGGVDVAVRRVTERRDALLRDVEPLRVEAKERTAISAAIKEGVA